MSKPKRSQARKGAPTDQPKTEEDKALGGSKSNPPVHCARPLEVSAEGQVTKGAATEGAPYATVAAPADPRQAFLDQTAIALHARGYPERQLWAQAEKLWASREAYLKAGSK